MLLYQIKNALHTRQGRAIDKFDYPLASPHSGLIRDALKDPYVWDFVRLEPGFDERDLEEALIRNIVRFLLDLGRGFSFVGRQHRLVIGGEEFFVDLLFYNYRLRRFFVVELKVGEFKPEHAGKMAFYLAAIDDMIRQTDDQMSIGLILCAGRNETEVRYTLRDRTAPIAVSEYVLPNTLPAQIEENLPSIAELQAVVKTTRHAVAGEEVVTRNVEGK